MRTRKVWQPVSAATLRRVYAYIDAYQTRRGYSPTVREITDALDLSSTSLAHYYLRKMETAGMIQRHPRVARAIVLR